MAPATYQICTNCIMDTTDPNITFDKRGWCDYCRNFHSNILPSWNAVAKEKKTLTSLIATIKKDGQGRKHDCLIGISGGVDSSYLAYLAKDKFGLRPLLLHVDAGWNSEISLHNIQRIVDGLGLDLHNIVVNWEEMKDLQRAFLKAQVPHQDAPQDHAFFASLYNFAAHNGFKYLLTGANYSTECIREPLEWIYHASDLRHIKDIHRRFGSIPLNSFPMADIFKYKIYYRFAKGLRVIKPLNYVPFVKESAIKELKDRFGWMEYGNKHYESRFTKFFEGYWLPRKFGYDKRRVYMSALILTQQLTRDEALDIMKKPPYDEVEMSRDFEYVAHRLDLTVDELRVIMEGENKSYRHYKSNILLINLATIMLKAMGIQKELIR